MKLRKRIQKTEGIVVIPTSFEDRVSSLKKRIFEFLYPAKSKKLYSLEAKWEAVKSSDKVVFIQPTVKVEGLEKLEKALYLTGDDMYISNNVITAKGGCKYLLSIMASDRVMVNSNMFSTNPEVEKVKKRKKK